MNAGPTLTVWLQLVGLLAVEVALVAGAGALIACFVASAAWRRTVWQVCVLSLLALTLSELTGTACSVVNWLAAKVSLENRGAARTTAANRNNEQPASGQLTEESLRKVAEQLAPEHQRKAVETMEAASLVVQPSGTDIRPSLAPIDALPKKNPANCAEAGGGSVADSLAILWFGLVWLMGAGLVIARGCLAHALFALFRRHRQAVSDAELVTRVEALARLLGIERRVHLVESSWLAGPIVFGVFRPVIGLPAGFAGRFSPVQQEAMLAHELAHLTAHDPVWYLLANWASAILWWHPIVWWARRQLHAASEQAADEASLLVADGPRVLAECLVEMGARLKRQPSLALLGVEGNGLCSSLGQRVERLVHLRANSFSSPSRLRSALAKTFGPAALVAIAILSTAWVGPQAFSKGESMKTMKQTWKQSLAAFALLATIGSEDAAARANGVEAQRDSMLGRAHVQAGKWLFDTGKLDEAEARMKEGQKENPGNPTAIRYLGLIEEQRSAQNANSKPRNATRPATALSKSDEEASPAAEPLVTKVYQLRYSDPTNLVAILKPTISQRSLVGVVPDTRHRQLIVVATEKKLREVDSLIEQLDKMPVGSVPGNTSTGDGSATEEPAQYYRRLMMERYGVIPKGEAPPVSEPPTNEQRSPYRLMMDRYGRTARGAPQPSVKPSETKERSAIASKLERIVLKEVTFDGVPLPEVLRFLDEETRKRDPDKKSINFLINPNTAQSAPASVIDPQTGQPITLPPPEPMDMNSVIVRFNLPLREVRLKDVLDAIVKVADKPIEYSIEEYGVLFSQAANQWADPTAAPASKSLESARLQVRTFKMDADKLLPGLKRAFGINLEGLPSDRQEMQRKELESLEKTLTNLLTQFTDQSPYVVKVRAQIDALKEAMKGKSSAEPGLSEVQVAFRRLLTQLGVNMDLPGKALFYNDLTGILMVRATTEDLAIVQGAVETLGGVANEQRPQAGVRSEGATASPADLMQRRYWPRSARK